MGITPDALLLIRRYTVRTESGKIIQLINVLFCLISLESREGIPEVKVIMWLLLSGSAKYKSKLSITLGPIFIGTNALVVLFFKTNLSQVIDLE